VPWNTTEARTEPLAASGSTVVGVARRTEIRSRRGRIVASYTRPVAVETQEPSGVTRRRVVDLDLVIRLLLACVLVVASCRGAIRMMQTRRMR
jgi:hypothetical protein